MRIAYHSAGVCQVYSHHCKNAPPAPAVAKGTFHLGMWWHVE